MEQMTCLDAFMAAISPPPGSTPVEKAYYKLKAQLALPAGIEIKLDPRTENVLVHGSQYGFCVTGVWAREHPDSIVADVQVWLAELVKAEQGVVVIRPLSELVQEAAEPTRWDDK